MDRVAASHEPLALRSFVRAGIAALVLSLGGHPANADQLALMHMRDFKMSVDRSTARIGEQIHLRVDLRVTDSVPRCDGVVLPDLYGFDSLGDERRIETLPDSTECVEIVTLSPTVPGDRTIAPATLDAIDASTNRPSRFSSNSVTLRVLHAVPKTEEILRDTALQMLKALVVIVLLAAIGWVSWWALRRVLPGFGQVQRIVPPEAMPPPPEPVDEREQWRRVVMALAAEPTRKNVLALRLILRERVGAREDEVFGELLARISASTDPGILDVLRAVERATFIDDTHLLDAVRDVLRAFERLSNLALS